jgi:hypothetical protein
MRVRSCVDGGEEKLPVAIRRPMQGHRGNSVDRGYLDIMPASRGSRRSLHAEYRKRPSFVSNSQLSTIRHWMRVRLEAVRNGKSRSFD